MIAQLVSELLYPGDMEQTLSLDIAATIENRQRLVGMKKEIERQIDLDTEAIKRVMVEEEKESVEAGEFTATLTVRERATLDKTELISQGVTTEQIKRATKVSTYVQLDVRARKA